MNNFNVVETRKCPKKSRDEAPNRGAGTIFEPCGWNKIMFKCLRKMTLFHNLKIVSEI